MTRLVAAVALLAVPAVASAQDGTLIPVGPPVVGGSVVTGAPIGNGTTALFPVDPIFIPRYAVGGGSMSGYPQVWVASGAWSNLNYAWPEVPVIELVVPVTKPASGFRPAAAGPHAALSGQAEAKLVVQFPAEAEVWVGGKKLEGDPAAEWTLTSPTLTLGQSHTFEVKGRWKADGKTFEVTRSMSVPVGERKRWVVVTGTQVKG